MTEYLRLSHVIAGREIGGDVAFEQRNPADPDDLIVSGPEAREALVADAVEAARAALPSIDKAGIEKRSDALAAIARALADDVDGLGTLIARETGKTIGDSRGEVLRAGRIFGFFAGEALRNVGEAFASTRPGVSVAVDHVPVGVVGAITPWNFPIAIPAWKIAPAIAFGNSVVWKPSELSSATAAAMMRIIGCSGLVNASVNMVLGAGETGRALCSAPLDAISFTGSVETGGHVRRAAMASGTRVQLEMGGVNGLIVLADADIGNAVDCALNGAFFAAGQRCTATSRIIVDREIADSFVAALLQRLGAQKLGNPLDPDTVIGPLAAMRQKHIIAAQVGAIEASGLTPLCGGSAVTEPHAFYPPTLFDHVDAAHPLAQDEIFGPVAAVIRVSGFDEAIEVLNGTRFGLSAGICTRSLLHAEKFKRLARAGMLMVNLPTAGIDYHAPFGGTAGSSYGPREQGRAAREFYTTIRTSYQLPL